jgi:hypothetical protein
MAPGKREVVVVVVCKWTDVGLCCCSVWVVVGFSLCSFCVLVVFSLCSRCVLVVFSLCSRCVLFVFFLCSFCILFVLFLVLFSGVPPDALTTLQGNPYTEACGDCGRQYLRDYLVRAKTSIPRKHKRYRGSHDTGRFCTHPECNGAVGGGRLYDNMVLPKEAIDPHTMRRALAAGPKKPTSTSAWCPCNKRCTTTPWTCASTVLATRF